MKNKKIILSSIAIFGMLFVGNGLANANSNMIEKIAPNYYNGYYSINNYGTGEIIDLINENQTILNNNSLIPDFNSFYNTNISLKVVLPDEIKAKFKDVYLLFGKDSNGPIYYAKDAAVTSENTTNDGLDYENNNLKYLIKYNFDKDKIPEKISIKNTDILNIDELDQDLSFAIFGKGIDGKEYRLSNFSYFYLYKDTKENKEKFLKTKLIEKNYQLYDYNYATKLDEIFKNIETKLGSPEDYSSYLDTLSEKVDKLNEKNKLKISEIINNIKDDNDFSNNEKISSRYFFINGILEQILQKIKDEKARIQSDVISNEIFGKEYTK